jgi:oxygen-independent coproporphyrinogen-3 oxidase
MAFEVDLAELGGFAAYPGAADALAPLAGDGLVAIDGERVRVTARGRPFARLAAQAFDAYRPMGQARHSRTV